jgi:hypothetical protein
MGRNSQEGPGHGPARTDSTPVKTGEITLSELAVADILEQADWYEARAGHIGKTRGEGGKFNAVAHVSRAKRRSTLRF